VSTDLDTMVDNARAALGSQGKRIGPASGAARYELFNAANSICSQKVRTVLAYHHIPWIHHPVDLFSGQSYLPDYVRLRMVGCEAFGGPLADRHRGSTSASVGGCDGVVVPTLVDRLAGEVVVD
jgi:2,5-dichlorohydroquinone reductive dechlorinase